MAAHEKDGEGHYKIAKNGIIKRGLTKVHETRDAYHAHLASKKENIGRFRKAKITSEIKKISAVLEEEV